MRSAVGLGSVHRLKPAERFSACDDDAPVAAAADEGIGNLQGVQDAVAGVGDVEDRAAQSGPGSDDVAVGGFLDIGADGGEQQQVDLARGEGRLLQCAVDGAGGEVGRQVAFDRDDALVQSVQPPQQAGRNPHAGAVLAQPVLDGLRALAASGQVDGDLRDTAVEAHAALFPALARCGALGADR